MLQNISKIIKELSEKLSYTHWMILAGVISALLGLLVYLSISSSEPAEPAKDTSTIKVVVATQDIQPKTIIQESMLTVVDMPAHLVPDDALSDTEEILHKPAKVNILQGDIVSKRKVIMDIKLAGFTGNIPPDCRAVTISINDVTGVAGFAKPGDYVDVMLVTKGDNKVMGRIVLQDVQLLAINQNSASGGTKLVAADNNANQEKNGDSSNKAALPTTQKVDTQAANTHLATATLALTPSDALKLITDAQEGTLYLVLRPYKPRDRFAPETSYTHFSSIKATDVPQPQQPTGNPAASQAGAGTGAPAPTAAPSSAPASLPSISDAIEVIRGTAVTREGV